MKNLNRSQLLSGDILAKIANSIIMALTISVMLVILLRDHLKDFLIMGLYTVSVLNTRYLNFVSEDTHVRHH